MIILSFLILLSSMLISCEEMSLIGDAIEASRPCQNGILTMERIIGGPPSKENYWDGILYLEELYPNLTEARFTLKLSAPANVSVDPEDGRIIANERGYHISYFKPSDGYKTLKFRVEGKPFGSFPDVVDLKLNDAHVCPRWAPTILGANLNIGILDDTSLINERIPQQETCGKRKVLHQGLITNGYPSDEGDWPWHAAIFHLEKTSYIYRCGGTVLNTNTILTAAHCVVDSGRYIVADRVLVKLGLHNRLVAGRNTEEFRVYKVLPHKKYNFGNFENDIAILKLSTEANYTNYVQPICLWPSNENNLETVIDQNGIVIGWGFDSNNQLTEILSQAEMPVVSQLTCLSSNRDLYGLFLSDKNYCAGFRNGTSVCNGDSGGGMFFKRDNSYMIRGLVSLSVTRENKAICNNEQYVIFTDVAKYLDWISNKL